MLDLLTSVLARAVPEVRVESVEVKWWSDEPDTSDEVYVVFVEPDHKRYWERFHVRYPHYKYIALRYGAKKHTLECLCPEFPTLKGLLGWLIDTLNLPQGERNLLHLFTETGCKC